MDLTQQNLETIASLEVRNASVEQRVAADRKAGDKFHLANGVWWRRVKQFFYLPVSYLSPLRPYESPPSPWVALGGYYHVVPEGEESNGSIVTNEIFDPSGFELANLKKGKNGSRKVREIEKGLALLSIRRIVNLEDLLRDGAQLFQSWEQRTVDAWSREITADNFSVWAKRAFYHPYDLLLGTYFDNRLVAFALINSSDGVASLVNTFGDHSMHKSHQVSPTTLLNYAYIKICSHSPGVHKVTNGLRSVKESLERYKAELGYRHITYPAFICLRRPVRPLVRLFMPVQYRRLMGEYAAAA